MREKPLFKSWLFWACCISVLLLAFFLGLQASGSRLIGLPVQWIWLSLIPIFLALVAGGYIGKFKAPGFEFEPGIQSLPYYPLLKPGDQQRSAVADSRPHVTDSTSTAPAGPSTSVEEELRQERDKEAARTRRYFLLHVCKPSTRPGWYDVRLFVIHHVQGASPNQKEGFADVEKAEFYFGKSWGQVFTANNDGGFLGVSTSAWGTFLATCRLTFKDPKQPPVILFRYVDFEMAHPAAG